MLLYFNHFFLFVDGIFASIVSDKMDINKEEAEANSKQTTTIYHTVMHTSGGSNCRFSHLLLERVTLFIHSFPK